MIKLESLFGSFAKRMDETEAELMNWQVDPKKMIQQPFLKQEAKHLLLMDDAKLNILDCLYNKRICQKNNLRNNLAKW